MAETRRIGWGRWMLPWMLSAAALSGAQSGALHGRLTDLHSHPVASATLHLRNQRTGMESLTTSSGNGSYDFRDLPAGLYTLSVDAPARGHGELTDLVIEPEHEEHLQTAMAFLLPDEPVRVAENRRPESILKGILAAPRSPPEIESTRLESRLPAGPYTELSLAARPFLLPDTSRLAEVPKPVEEARLTLPPGLLPLVKWAASGEGLSVHSPSVPVAVLQPEQIEEFPLPGKNIVGEEMELAEDSAVQLTGEQVRSLPVVQRDWPTLLTVPVEESQEDPKVGGMVRRRHGNTRMIGADRPLEGELPEAWLDVDRPHLSELSIHSLSLTSGSDRLQTLRGGERLHGQGFLFARAPVLGARNPFTAWLKETSAATSGTIPTFTAEPWTPNDQETQWGVAAGRALRQRRLYGYAAVEGLQRQDPAAAMARHPDLFFVRPGDDQLRVLAARLNLSSVDPVTEGLAAYSSQLENIAGLLGKAPRTISQWKGSARFDWHPQMRNALVLEADAQLRNAPGGGLSRTAEPYGIASFGSAHSSQQEVQLRWLREQTNNLHLLSQFAMEHLLNAVHAETPTALEQTYLTDNAWGQLPQIRLDSRYGFILGNPAGFGRGSNPRERQWLLREQVDWKHGDLLLTAGGELRNARDALSRLRNQTGSYNYSTVENFVSDSLVFARYGINASSDPLIQTGCDQTGKVWRDSSATLHGIGSLPCYNSYTQTLGPSDWWLSTNDWAAWSALQWRPRRTLLLSTGLRWEKQQTPPPFSALLNSDLPLAGRIPDLGNAWEPRVSLAWGNPRGFLPVVCLGYGRYEERTNNRTLLTALTHTGSQKGDLHYRMRPTDNLYSGGAPPFPVVLTGAPGTIIKPSAVEMASGYRNPVVHQAELSLEQRLPGGMTLTVAGEATLGRGLPRAEDANIDPAVNPGTLTWSVKDSNSQGPIRASTLTVPFYATWSSNLCASATATDSLGRCGRLWPNYQQVNALHSQVHSSWQGLVVRLDRSASKGLSMHLRYTWSHSVDGNPEAYLSPERATVFDPASLRLENGSSDQDVRHAASALMTWRAPWRWQGLSGRIANGWAVAGVGHFHSGLPYSMRVSGSIPKEFLAGAAIVGLSEGMNGYGGEDRVYGVGRNTYRLPAVWKADLRLSRRFAWSEERSLEVLAESFNLFNHANVIQREETGYYLESGSSGGGLPTLNFMSGARSGTTAFGESLNVNATTNYREREFELGIRLHF